jgi:hypothetical protein
MGIAAILSVAAVLIAVAIVFGINWNLERERRQERWKVDQRYTERMLEWQREDELRQERNGQNGSRPLSRGGNADVVPWAGERAVERDAFR